MINTKLIGGILLIVGTSIGGGMLALPVSVSPVGFYHSLVFLFLCWLIMTSGALLVLEVNLRLPRGANMISMVKQNLGLPGQIVAWITYLLLLYTLLSAYISGGSDVFSGILKQFSFELPNSVAAIVFTCFFGLIVYQGIRVVDYVNRGLMFGKLGVYLLLIAIISPHVDTTHLTGGNIRAITSSLMILITSFGFASIVPTLRDYFHDDVASLRKVIIYGSLIPLICYIAWIGVIMGVIANKGEQGLISLLTSEHATSGLTTSLYHALHNSWISGLFSFFTSICMLTAFLGVSIGLFDFLADGFHLNKSGIQGNLTLTLTFLPPLIVVLFNPGIYLHALSYAGVCCVILLLLLPAVMAWIGRKNAKTSNQILIPGGNISLGLLILIGCYLLYLAW